MIEIIEETGSTNADLAAAIRAGAPPAEGSWLVARRQTAGRGRQARKWVDRAGNFKGSTVVNLLPADPPAATLSFVAALAVADAVDAALMGSSHPQLKWPNDVLLAGGKLAGILLEMVGRRVIVGIGVNLEHAPELPDRKTAAVSDFVSEPTIEAFADDLAQCFAKRVKQWRSGGLPTVLHDFMAWSVHRSGDPIAVHDSGASLVEGTFVDLEESDGALRIRLANGAERVIRAGDVS